MSSPEKALADLLLSLFQAHELRWFLRTGPEGADVSAALPEMAASDKALAESAVDVLLRRGLVGDEFFTRLVEERSRKKHEIEEVRALFAGRPGSSAPAAARAGAQYAALLRARVATSHRRKRIFAVAAAASLVVGIVAATALVLLHVPPDTVAVISGSILLIVGLVGAAFATLQGVNEEGEAEVDGLVAARLSDEQAGENPDAVRWAEMAEARLFGEGGRNGR